MDYTGLMVATEGYSGTPLVRKLGFRPGWRVLVQHAPAHYPELVRAAEDVQFDHDPEPAVAGYQAAHMFLSNSKDIADMSRTALARLAPGGMLWLSWAKKSSPLHSGVTGDALRASVLPLGWVDVKVCAVDADWSGLKFLKRKAKPA